MTPVFALCPRAAVSASIVCALLGACGGEHPPPPPRDHEAPAAAPSPSADPAPSAAATAAPEPAQPTSIRFGAGFTPDPWVLMGEVDGHVDATGLDADCSGYVSSTPNILLEANTAITELTLVAESSGPGITLMVQGPDGEFRCSTGDDAHVSGYFTSGEHKIWLGTPEEDQHRVFRLGFSELPDLSAAIVASATLAP